MVTQSVFSVTCERRLHLERKIGFSAVKPINDVRTKAARANLIFFDLVRAISQHPKLQQQGFYGTDRCCH